MLKKATEANKDYFVAIKGAKIINHSSLSRDVKMTQFDNGITVYVNYSEKEYETPIGVVKGESYIYDVGGASS